MATSRALESSPRAWAPSFPEAAPAFVVSIAGTGVDGGAILSDQSARILRAAGADEDAIRGIDAAHRALMDAMRNEEVEPAVIEPLLAELQDRQLAWRVEPRRRSGSRGTPTGRHGSDGITYEGVHPI